MRENYDAKEGRWFLGGQTQQNDLRRYSHVGTLSARFTLKGATALEERLARIYGLDPNLVQNDLVEIEMNSFCELASLILGDDLTDMFRHAHRYIAGGGLRLPVGGDDFTSLVRACRLITPTQTVAAAQPVISADWVKMIMAYLIDEDRGMVPFIKRSFPVDEVAWSQITSTEGKIDQLSTWLNSLLGQPAVNRYLTESVNSEELTPLAQEISRRIREISRLVLSAMKGMECRGAALDVETLALMSESSRHWVLGKHLLEVFYRAESLGIVGETVLAGLDEIAQRDFMFNQIDDFASTNHLVFIDPRSQMRIVNNYVYVELFYEGWPSHRVLVRFPYNAKQLMVTGVQAFYQATYTGGVLDENSVKGPIAFLEDILAHQADIDAWIIQMILDEGLIMDDGSGRGVTKPGKLIQYALNPTTNLVPTPAVNPLRPA